MYSLSGTFSKNKFSKILSKKLLTYCGAYFSYFKNVLSKKISCFILELNHQNVLSLPVHYSKSYSHLH